MRVATLPRIIPTEFRPSIYRALAARPFFAVYLLLLQCLFCCNTSFAATPFLLQYLFCCYTFFSCNAFFPATSSFAAMRLFSLRNSTWTPCWRRCCTAWTTRRAGSDTTPANLSTTSPRCLPKRNRFLRLRPLAYSSIPGI